MFAILKRPILILAVPIVVLLSVATLWFFVLDTAALPAPPHSNSVEVESTHYVVMSPERVRNSDIQVEPVRRCALTHTHTVSGRVIYNEDQHVEISAPTTGILTQILVSPGDRVSEGQILAWLCSPELGTARADVLQRHAIADLTRQLSERSVVLDRNVESLASQLSKGEAYDNVITRFETRLLGDYRRSLFGAAARMELARSAVTRATPLARTGAMAHQVLQERQAELRAASSTLLAACEQAILDSWKERKEAESEADDARRRLVIAKQHLASLLLNEAIVASTGSLPDSEDLGATDTEPDQLARFAIRAPMAGSIETREFSANERVLTSDPLFVLADTTSLWIEADVRENDWAAVRTQPGRPLTVTVPALGDRQLEASVRFVGREVREESNSVPLVAEVCNASGLLRPGLFVRVKIPVAEHSDVLTVPASAVVSHDGQSFVFVGNMDGTFRRNDVVSDGEGDGRMVIESGLTEHDSVVTRGAFLLKSELLLHSGEE